MGDMADYYRGLEDPFDADDTYWRGGKPDPEDGDGPPLLQRSRPTATVWVTRDGQRVKVTAITDSHLVNTIRMLRRHAEVKMMADAAHLGAYLDSDPPDGAYGAATQAEGELLEMDADDYLESTCPTFPALLAEAEKRGLDLAKGTKRDEHQTQP